MEGCFSLHFHSVAQEHKAHIPDIKLIFGLLKSQFSDY